MNYRRKLLTVTADMEKSDIRAMCELFSQLHLSRILENKVGFGGNWLILPTLTGFFLTNGILSASAISYSYI